MSFITEPVVRVRNVDIVQDDTIVLNECSFEIEKGELVFLVGRTGSGKSSLLKTLYADLPLQIGDIQVAGFDLKTLKPSQRPLLRRRLGIIFQDFQLFSDRTVAENLFFVMQATGWHDRGKMKARLSEVLMRVGLSAVENKYPHQISGGEQQRVVIARALINEPQILLADEPTGNLDPAVSDGIFKLFLEINNSGTAILMATHDYALISNYPARLLKCDGGRLLDSSREDVQLDSERMR